MWGSAGQPSLTQNPCRNGVPEIAPRFVTGHGGTPGGGLADWSPAQPATISGFVTRPVSIAYKAPAFPPPTAIVRCVPSIATSISAGPDPPRSLSALSSSHQLVGVQEPINRSPLPGSSLMSDSP